MIKKLNLFSLTFFYCLILVGCAKDNDIFDLAIQQDIDENIVAEENNEPEETEEEEEEPDATEEDLPGLEDKYNGVLKAFPSAEGYGKNAIGGRFGSVYHVTNLDDRGPGSFRDAVSQSNRIVIFDIGGVLNLSSNLFISSSNLTIDFSSAPSEGIEIQGGRIDVDASNIIIRNMKIRSNGIGGEGDGALRIVGAHKTVQNIILDHCSIAYGADENLTILTFGSGQIENVTVQNTMINENMGTGGVLLFVGGDNNSGQIKNVTFFENMETLCHDRYFYSSVAEVQSETINNIIYGYRGNVLATFGQKVDWVGNVFKASNEVENAPWNPSSMFDYGINNNNSPGEVAKSNHIFESDNLMINNPFRRSVSSNVWKQFNSSSRAVASDLEPYSSSLVESRVLNNVGAGAKTINGIDSIDKNLINHYYNGTGKIADSAPTSDDYANPVFASHPAEYDKDNDGLSDDWELRNFGSLEEPSLGDFNDNGYSNIEEFLFWLNNE